MAVVLIQSVWFAVSTMMAVLARKRFGAGDWETMAVTAAVPTLMIFSVFWDAVLRRVGVRRFLAINWACTTLPLAVAALSTGFWFLLGCHVMAAIGAAGWSPVSGDLLKRFYGDRVRGRAFGVINTAIFLGMTLVSYVVGRSLDHDDDVFRVYLPAATAAYGLGVVLLRRLVAVMDRQTNVSAAPPELRPVRLRSLFAPIVHLRSVLREDRRFYRYEAAFMTYGMGWMICNALLPVLATDRLRMTYTQFAAATQVAYPLGLLLMTFPMGWVLDRIGPTRTSALSFACLALYPLGLLAADRVATVAAVTVLYGIAMAGVHMGWMLGPVALAPSPDRVAHYVAIHASLVGLRGILAQGLGMFIYRMTGSFTWPFLIAAAAILWASLQMWRLHELTRAARPGFEAPDAA